MKQFDIFISYISWDGGGKSRPVLIYVVNKSSVKFYPVTTQYDNKSETIKAQYFKIIDWVAAGLSAQSYVDTGTRLNQPVAMFEKLKPIGSLSQRDKQRLIKFLSK
jgi:hypothetical protein